MVGDTSGLRGTAMAPAPARFISYPEARPLLSEMSGALPSELRALTPAQIEPAWAHWVDRHDREIRARLAQGDEDTIVNWLLFGTSFTSRPRAVLGAVDAAGDPEAVLRRTIELISARLDDLLQALAAPGTDERRLFARSLLERKGLRFATAADREAARDYLLAAVIRVASEQDQVQQELGATANADPAAEFVQRSTLYSRRGLSLDTSLLPNYSVDQALTAMKARGLLKPGAVRRIAIVGPGLDFADKDVGFDFYPQQTIDLVSATYVLIYYDRFEQALALSNVVAILNRGGVLLANFSAPRLTSITIRPIETTTTLYARTANEVIRDFIVWYGAPTN